MAIRFQKTGVFPHGMAPSEERAALRTVEVCGRTAYKSEDRISEDSAAAFVNALKRRGHLSVLEHSNIVLRISGASAHAEAGGVHTDDFRRSLVNALGLRNGYHRICPLDGPSSGDLAIAGNFRSWIETIAHLKDKDDSYYHLFAASLSGFFPVLFGADYPRDPSLSSRVSLMGEEEQLALLRRDMSKDLPVFIFKIICDRGITHEIVRHRVLSFTQESTRYVNYQNKGMRLILPEELLPFFDAERGGFTVDDPLVEKWSGRAKILFDWYQEDLARGRRPEIARDILPNLLKSEIFVSGRWSGWRHFLDLRDAPQAHPRIRFIAEEIKDYFRTLELSAS